LPCILAKIEATGASTLDEKTAASVLPLLNEFSLEILVCPVVSFCF
jgi:hypothetical protein